MRHSTIYCKTYHPFLAETRAKPHSPIFVIAPCTEGQLLPSFPPSSLVFISNLPVHCMGSPTKLLPLSPILPCLPTQVASLPTVLLPIFCRCRSRRSGISFFSVPHSCRHSCRSPPLLHWGTVWSPSLASLFLGHRLSRKHPLEFVTTFCRHTCPLLFSSQSVGPTYGTSVRRIESPRVLF